MADGMMSPREPMPLRSFRAPDKLWEAAQATAEERNENLSEEIRKFLERYTEEGNTK